MDNVVEHRAVATPAVFEHRSVETRTESQCYFSRKVIVITGAGGQFGREGCLYFARRGASVAGLDMDSSALQGTLDALRTEIGPRLDCKLLMCDVTNAAQVQLVVESIALSFGRIDLLWNNAGYQGLIKPTLDYDPADFAKVMSINVTGALRYLISFVLLQPVPCKSHY
jgi:NAD(P)-dependent dehydrogenase (short-subunit alcohol dehydrogenase family)